MSEVLRKTQEHREKLGTEARNLFALETIADSLVRIESLIRTATFKLPR